MQSVNPPADADARPLTTAELLAAIHGKFAENFTTSRPIQSRADDAEAYARKVSSAATELRARAGENVHQRLLATYIDEIFGDSVCALYLASCGLNIPARMLLRRSLELGTVVVVYWDAPADFFQWRDHDGDIRFSTLYAALTKPGYLTHLTNVRGDAAPINEKAVFGGLSELYGELSDVVHPKPYNFSTKSEQPYSFDAAAFDKTIDLAEKVYRMIFGILSARFSDMKV